MTVSDEAFRIYVEQLRHGHVEKISENLSPAFLAINDQELRFESDIAIEGEAYLADDNLILHLQIATQAIIPCRICNGPVEVKLELPNFYHMEALADVKTGIFDFSDMLREAILLEVPSFGECHEGLCPERKVLKKYLKEPQKGKEKVDSNGDEGYQPFADLDIEGI